MLETGRPVEILRREAEDAEQVVLGSRGRGGFTGLLLGSVHSAAALEYAFEEAARRGARLHAIHTWQMPVVGQGATVYTPLFEEISAAGRRIAADTLTPWREKYPQVEVEETVVCGHPVAVVCEVPRRDRAGPGGSVMDVQNPTVAQVMSRTPVAAEPDESPLMRGTFRLVPVPPRVPGE